MNACRNPKYSFCGISGKLHTSCRGRKKREKMEDDEGEEMEEEEKEGWDGGKRKE